MDRVKVGVLVGLLFFLSCVTSSSNAKKSSGRAKLVIPIPMEISKTTYTEECRHDRCMQDCYDKAKDAYDVRGNCYNLTCVCQYTPPCTLKTCYRLCKRQQAGKDRLGLQAICVRSDCNCDWGDKCERWECHKSCIKQLRWNVYSTFSVQSRCVNEVCICNTSPKRVRGR
ncbi:uncharacterized protein LOC119453205 [Dermacentor silvarum]|uniref:uncharacterized protein LOC119453205 n=1 Tax=Dermacentor silvarum TaxID=543639 RepID=UPI002101A174|nr:uncharacterized protein LOC119453205 [Dermacentor silvarum]